MFHVGCTSLRHIEALLQAFSTHQIGLKFQASHSYDRKSWFRRSGKGHDFLQVEDIWKASSGPAQTFEWQQSSHTRSNSTNATIGAKKIKKIVPTKSAHPMASRSLHSKAEDSETECEIRS